MNFLLDTNICVAALNGRPKGVAERIADAIASGHAVAISTIVVFELQYGVAKSTHVEQNTRGLTAFLKPLVIVPFDDEDARTGGQLRATLERRGEPIGPYDYLIAAQASRGDFILVTANTKEFMRVPNLRHQNWIA